MKEQIKHLSDKAEFVLVTFIAFSYVVATSTLILLLRLTTFELTTSRLLRGIAVEVLILLVIAWILHAREWTPEKIGFRFSWAAAFAGVPLFIAYFFIAILAGEVAMAIFPTVSTQTPFQLSNSAPIVLLVTFLVLNSLFEETLVSGYVITSLAPLGAAFSISASTLFRFAYHLYQGPLVAFSILPLGVIFGFVFWRWRTLWPLIVAHTLTNLAAFSVAALREGAA